MKKIRKTILPAAGLGTRFLPATKASPKEMLPLVDKPLIQYAVEESMQCGIHEFIIITGKNKRAIEDHFDSSFVLEERLKSSGKDKLLHEINRLNHLQFAYIRQRQALGLGHAILCAKPFVQDDAFAVILSDDVIDPDYPLLKDMMKVYETTGCPVIALQEVPPSETHRYGIVAGERKDDLVTIRDLVEKPKKNAPSNLAIIGRYILTFDIFEHLEKVKPGAGGEIQLTDALKSLAKDRPIYGIPLRGKRYDAGEKLGYLEASVELALKNPELAEDFVRYLRARIAQL
ncbi:MAG TPA: UTP--glucose-1-phosphate uridylyltransferase GalU [Dissulfurispiraceae bacterium]|nr:UTP--glucose-1-phosphate uridylyltransferase GalU [Dissulfurispiraceae bacterium]